MFARPGPVDMCQQVWGPKLSSGSICSGLSSARWVWMSESRDRRSNTDASVLSNVLSVYSSQHSRIGNGTWTSETSGCSSPAGKCGSTGTMRPGSVTTWVKGSSNNESGRCAVPEVSAGLTSFRFRSKTWWCRCVVACVWRSGRSQWSMSLSSPVPALCISSSVSHVAQCWAVLHLWSYLERLPVHIPLFAPSYCCLVARQGLHTPACQ